MKYCFKCGTQLSDWDKFCPKCGISQTQETNHNRTNNKQIFDDYTSEKSRLVATLLALFLGGFGALDFYIGRKKIGIIKLILTIINLLLTIIVIVLMLQITKEQGSMSDQETMQAVYSLIIPYIFIWIISMAEGIWNLVDLILCLCGSMKDSEGKTISNWK